MRTIFRAVAFAIAFSTFATAANAEDDLIAKIKDRGVIRICLTDSPPMTIKDPRTNEWTGMFVEIAASLAESLGVKPEYVDSTWGTLVQSLQTDKCDISAAETYVTAARAQQALYTGTIAYNSQAVFVRGDDPVASLAELDKPGKTVAVIAGSVNERYAAQTFKNANIKAIVTDRQSTPLLEVASKRADATLMGLSAAVAVLRGNSSLRIRKLDHEPLFPVAEAWMVPLGEYHFQQYVDIVLGDLKHSGQFQALEDKWLKVD